MNSNKFQETQFQHSAEILFRLPTLCQFSKIAPCKPGLGKEKSRQACLLPPMALHGGADVDDVVSTTALTAAVKLLVAKHIVVLAKHDHGCHRLTYVTGLPRLLLHATTPPRLTTASSNLFRPKNGRQVFNLRLLQSVPLRLR